jgi:hypothetical protein
MKKKIFVSIAAYMDLELYQTVKSLLENSSGKNNITVSVYSQNKIHPDIDSLKEKFNFNLIYVKTDEKNARGVCYARFISNSFLDISYDYFLQIDSHTLFSRFWDKDIIFQYEKSQKYFNKKIIFSTYPYAYRYIEGNPVMIDEDQPNSIAIQKVSDFWKYKAMYKNYEGDQYGEITNYFCGGFAFGKAEYFIDNPYDKLIYIEGEEITMSIRMRCKDIFIVAPPTNYLYHNYVGLHEYSDKRVRLDDFTNLSENKESVKNLEWHIINGRKRVESFFNFEIEDSMGISSKSKYESWLSEVKWYNEDGGKNEYNKSV